MYIFSIQKLLEKEQNSQNANLHIHILSIFLTVTFQKINNSGISVNYSLKINIHLNIRNIFFSLQKTKSLTLQFDCYIQNQP